MLHVRVALKILESHDLGTNSVSHQLTMRAFAIIFLATALTFAFNNAITPQIKLRLYPQVSQVSHIWIFPQNVNVRITLFEKSHFCPKIQFWQNFTIFFGKSTLSTTKMCKSPTFSRIFHPNFFLTIFLVKSKLSTAKKSKTAAFSRVFKRERS